MPMKVELTTWLRWVSLPDQGSIVTTGLTWSYRLEALIHLSPWIPVPDRANAAIACLNNTCHPIMSSPYIMRVS